MTYEIVLSYSTTDGVDAYLDCDDESFFEEMHDDEIFQDIVRQLMARFRDKASAHDEAGC